MAISWSYTKQKPSICGEKKRIQNIQCKTEKKTKLCQVLLGYGWYIDNLYGEKKAKYV